MKNEDEFFFAFSDGVVSSSKKSTSSESPAFAKFKHVFGIIIRPSTRPQIAV